MTVVRYRLDSGQAIGLLAHAGLEPAGPLLGHLSGSPAELPEEVLGDGGLAPTIREAMATANAPQRVVEVLTVVPETGMSTVARLASDATGRWVAIAGETDLDLAIAETDDEAALLIDDLVLASAFPGEAGSGIATLSAAGVLALAAASDAQRELRLRYDFNRAGPEPQVTFDQGEIRRLTDLGLDRGDTRWAVTAIAPLMPGEVDASAVEAATAELQEAGLVETSADKLTLTDAGREVTGTFDGAVRASRVRLAVLDADAYVTVAELMLIRSVARLVAAVWTGLAADPQATVMVLNGGDAVRLVGEMIGAGR